MIHLRAKRQAMKMTNKMENRNLRNVIENKAQVSRVSDGSGTENSHRTLLPHGSPARNVIRNATIIEETCFAMATTTDTGEEDSHGASEVIKSPLSDDTDHVIPNDKSTEFMLSPASEDNAHDFREGDSGYSAPLNVEVETRFSAMTSPTSPKNLLSPPPKTSFLGFRNHSPKHKGNNAVEESPRKHVTRFNFHMRHSKKKKEKLSTRRERKATKTLAIVLGKDVLIVLLIYWVIRMTF